MSKIILSLSLLILFLVVHAVEVAPAAQIKIDGKLNEAAWKRAPKNSGFSLLKNQAKKSAKPDVDSSFSILTDKNYIYIGIRCNEPNMHKLRANIHTNGHVWSDDVVEIFLSPTGKADEYYQFVIAAGGGRWQQFYAEKGVIRPDKYAPIYDTKVFEGKDFWSIEMRIPLEAFYMTKSKFWSSEWLVNIARQQMTSKLQWSSWSKLKNSFHEVDIFNRIGKFPPKPPQKDIYIKNIKAKLNSPNSGSLILNVEVGKAASGIQQLKITSNALKKIPVQKIHLKGGSNIVVVKGVTFKKNGKINITALMKNNKGKNIAGRSYNAKANYKAFNLEFTSPAYANCFFPGQDSKQLKGELNFTMPADKVVITINGKKSVFSVKGEKLIFNIDIASLKAEKILVQFDIFKNNKKKYSKTIVTRKLKARSNKMVWIVPPGRIVVNGKNTFIQGWYGGENTWCVSSCLQEKYPNQAAKHPVNMATWVNIQPQRLIRGIEGKEATKDVKPCKEIFAKIRKKIAANKNNDFMVYYLSDEPECRGVSPTYLKYLYDYIKELDPYHPVMIISRDPATYIDCADILNPHKYLGPRVNSDGSRLLNVEVDNVRAVCNDISKTERKGKIIMFTPQTFSYGFNNNEAAHTSFDETNASIWSSICYGAQGITPYIWHGHVERPDLRNGMDFIFTSTDRLGEILSESVEPCKIKNSNPMTDARLINTKNKILLIVVNVTPQKQDTTIFSNSLKNISKLYRFREDGEKTVKNGKLSFQLTSYQVIILTSPKMDQNLPKLVELRKKIKQDEYKRTHRGNILFGKGREIEVSSSYSGYTYLNSMAQQEGLFDGMIDCSAWIPRKYKELWYELAFPKFIPKFSKTKIHGNGLAGMTLKIWKYGEWITPKAKITDGKYMREYDFGKTFSTVKIRMEFKKPQPGLKNRFELYEFELLK